MKIKYIILVIVLIIGLLFAGIAAINYLFPWNPPGIPDEFHGTVKIHTNVPNASATFINNGNDKNGVVFTSDGIQVKKYIEYASEMNPNLINVHYEKYNREKSIYDIKITADGCIPIYLYDVPLFTGDNNFIGSYRHYICTLLPDSYNGEDLPAIPPYVLAGNASIGQINVLCNVDGAVVNIHSPDFRENYLTLVKNGVAVVYMNLNYLEASEYDIQVTADNYKEQTLTNITLPSENSVTEYTVNLITNKGDEK